MPSCRPDLRHEIIERHGGRDAVDVLQEELEHLRAIAGSAAAEA